MHTVKLLIKLVENYQILVYFIILIGLIFEGEVILISSGILLHLGALQIGPVILAIVLGLIGKTLLGYQIGIFIYKEWNNNKFVKYVEKRVSNVMPHFKQKPFWSIFASKFIFGVNNMVIIFAGYEKIDYKTYLKAEGSSTLVWAPLVTLLGFFFSYTAIHVSREIWKFTFVILVLIIAFFLFDKLVGWIYEIFEEFYDTK